MSLRSEVRGRWPLTRTLGLLLLATATAGTLHAADLARCAAVSAPDARLACYDQLAARAASQPAAAKTRPTPNAAADSPSGSAPAAVVIGPDDPNDAQNFGLTPSQLHVEQKGPTVIHARITTLSAGANGQTSALLDNGQTWAFVNEDARLRPGDALTIKRASLSSFMIITPSNHTFHGHRTQ